MSNLRKAVTATVILAAGVTAAWLGINDYTGGHRPVTFAQKSEDLAPDASPTLALAPADCCGGKTPATAEEIRAQDEQNQKRMRIMAAFDTWAERYARTPAEQRGELLAEGVALAQQRRPLMLDLIKSNPREAIAMADRLSPLARKELPAEVAEDVERLVSAKGRLDVLGMVGAEGNAYLRRAYIGSEMYSAFTYGNRLAPIPETDSALIGVALSNTELVEADGGIVERKENLLALREDKFRVLSKAEIALQRQNEAQPATHQCPISGKDTTANGDESAVDVGGEIVWLCKDGHVGPYVHTAKGQLIAAGGTSTLAAVGGPGEGAGSFPSIPAGWTTGNKTMIAMPVRFSNQSSNPFGSADITGSVSTSCSRLGQWSYGRMTVSWQVTPILTLPRKEAYYKAAGSPEGAMMSDAIAEAKKKGYNPDVVNFRQVIFTGSIGSYTGLAYIVGRDSWIKDIQPTTMTHELGHNLGLPHANSWTPTTGNPIGAGSHCEYCGAYNTMSYTNWGGAAYDTMMRYYIRWLNSDEAHDVTSSGTYRIYEPDIATLTAGRKHTIRIAKQAGQYYFVEFRPQATALSNGEAMDNTTKNGIRVLRTNGSELLDVTPGSANGTWDAALTVGQTFNDTSAGISISPVLKGGTNPEEYMDVSVTFSAPALYSGGVYELQPQCAPGLALDVVSAQDADGADVILWAGHSGPGQQWKLEDQGNGLWEVIPLCAPGRRLEVYGAGSTNGTNVDIWADGNASNERWTLSDVGNGYFELIPSHASSERLDVANGGNGNGTNVQIWQSNGGPAQRWRLLATGPQNGATYTFEPECAPGKRLAVSGGANADGANVVIWDSAGDASQQWKLEDQGNGQWELIPQCATSRRLEVSGVSSANGANVDIWADVNGSNERWSIVSEGNGYCELVPAHAPGSRCDVFGGGTANGTDVVLWQWWGGSTQRWRLFRN